MVLPAFLRSIIGWLRAGYPEGVPDVGYIPLFALLGSQLTDDEVRAIAGELASSSSDAASARSIHEAIEAVTHVHPNESDIARVRARLAAGRWRHPMPADGGLACPPAPDEPLPAQGDGAHDDQHADVQQQLKR